MTDPIDMSTHAAARRQRSRSEQLPSSPLFGHSTSFQLPSPIITKRTRTFSLSEKAAAAPEVKGKVKFFCRNKGHGFIEPENGTGDLFFHISDIEGEFAPVTGDEVRFRICPIPPKNEKYQATHVVILNLAPGKHERWDAPPSPRN